MPPFSQKTGLPAGVTPKQFEAMSPEEQRHVDQQVEANVSQPKHPKAPHRGNR
ncbi:MAG: hypothetical protein ACRYFX_18755 [Janthinobacterium lividum]